MSNIVWEVATAVAVIGWVLMPVINFYAPMILSSIGFDASNELLDLKIRIIPELKKTLRAVDRVRMTHRKGKEPSDLEALDHMAAKLRHALEVADDISDDQQENESYRNRFWQRLYSGLKISWGWSAPIVWSGLAWLWWLVRKIFFHLSEVAASAVATCVVSCMPIRQIARNGFVAGFNRSCTGIADIFRSGSARLSQWLCGSNDILPRTNKNTGVHSQQPVPGTHVSGSDETIPAKLHSEGVVNSDAASHDQAVPEICSESEGTVSDEPRASALLRGSDDRLSVTGNSVAQFHQPVSGTNVSASDETIPAEIHSEGVVESESDEIEPITTTDPASDEPAVVATSDAASQGPILKFCITRFNMSCKCIASSGPWLSRCCTSIHKWSIDAREAIRAVPDRACAGIGFTSDKHQHQHLVVDGTQEERPVGGQRATP